MSDIAGFLTAGTITGIVVLSLKSGMGCGLSPLRRRELILFAGVYAAAAGLVGILSGIVPAEVTGGILGIGLLVHVIIALGLIGLGIRTRKDWLARNNDISRRSFLWLSLPCPVCLTATFLACIVLADTTGMDPLRVSLGVAAIFFLGITASALAISWASTKMSRKNPSTLGSVMIFLGLFYLLCPLIIPAYIEAQQMPEFSVAVDCSGALMGLAVLAVPIVLGAFVHRSRQFHLKGGQ
ncbi:MAG: DUF2162 domain-containing protein [Candidatus Methanomethylophilaceae archaeon]|jgi:predicted transporter|nr:DUF2162 domain-containing protein [Candidatus Methanomethylophilaceae archaeon]